MKHLTYADKSLLVDDAAVDSIMEYARALGVAGKTDMVELRAIGSDGNEVVATFLLNANTEMIAESASSTAELPPNDEAVSYMREQTRLLLQPPPARDLEDEDLADRTTWTSIDN
jgi:hypothetical protein